MSVTTTTPVVLESASQAFVEAAAKPPYAPDVQRRGEPYASPLRAADEQFAGLPPSFVIVDEADVLDTRPTPHGRGRPGSR